MSRALPATASATATVLTAMAGERKERKEVDRDETA